MAALPAVALSGSLPAHGFQFIGDSGDSVLDAAAVGFQLGFAFAAAHADTALLPGQVAPKAGQPGQQMLELRQLDLQLAFPRTGALGADARRGPPARPRLAIRSRRPRHPNHSGPVIPPSFRIRQKWIAIRKPVARGNPTTCRT